MSDRKSEAIDDAVSLFLEMRPALRQDVIAQLRAMPVAEHAIHDLWRVEDFARALYVLSAAHDAEKADG